MRACEAQDRLITAEIVVVVHQRFLQHKKAAGCPGKQPVQVQSQSVEWYTPPSILGLVRELFGESGIDLDPCSSNSAQSLVKAGQYFTQASDGLAESWFGKVFVNPPFGVVMGKSQQGRFLEKSIAEFEAGRVSEVVLLLKAAVGYTWFNKALQYPHALLHSLVAFYSATSSPSGINTLGPLAANPHGSVVVYLGHNTDRFCEVFSAIGHIPGMNSWAAAA